MARSTAARSGPSPAMRTRSRRPGGSAATTWATASISASGRLRDASRIAVTTSITTSSPADRSRRATRQRDGWTAFGSTCTWSPGTAARSSAATRGLTAVCSARHRDQRSSRSASANARVAAPSTECWVTTQGMPRVCATRTASIASGATTLV